LKLTVDGSAQEFLSGAKVMVNVASVYPSGGSNLSQIEAPEHAVLLDHFESNIDQPLLGLGSISLLLGFRLGDRHEVP
jgi:hypothetical protein